jgi:hypothetical protein
MYEGLTAPAEAYRYLHPPPGLESKPPTSARESVPPRQGESPPLDPMTTEMPPQAQLNAAQDTFALPPGTTAVVATVDPVDPPSTPPVGGDIQGNVYRIRVSVNGTELPVRPRHSVTVVLRGPAGIPGPTIERYAAGTWTKLTTLGLGSLSGDSYTADTDALGDFALVGRAAPPPGAGGDPFLVVLVIAAVVLTVGTLIALRRQRRRTPPPRATPGRAPRRPRPRGR